MIVAMAWKTLAAHPVRTAVLGVGFGLGVGVMATLLGVGEVVLEQARAPALAGGGDLVVTSAAGPVTSARFVLQRLRAIASTGGNARKAGASLVVASPRRRADLFLVRAGTVVPVRARGGIPSLERALGDPETAGASAWIDASTDLAWSAPQSGDVLRAMDRFHRVPNVPARASSWAEWLYFKGRSGDDQFYLTFLAGPGNGEGGRAAGVRLQLDHGGHLTTFSDEEVVPEAALLTAAPDLAIGRSRVRLEGLRYHITLDLPGGATGEIFIDAEAGRAFPPLSLRGAGGWVSGYTVPVMSGVLSGWIAVRGTRVELSGTGYHDHNWGFWEGVSWRWGQVQHEGYSYVYGRVYPPADAADPQRIPGFLVALGPDGPVGFSTHVSIEETDDPATRRPRRIHVRGASDGLDLDMDLAVESAIITPGGALARGPDFLQLRAQYRVTGTAGGEKIDFTAAGSAETFRGR